MAALDFPDNPATGDLYGSSGTVWRWDGARWASTAGASGARGRVAYAQITASQAGFNTQAPVAGLSVTFVADPARVYRTTVHLDLLPTVAGDLATCYIHDGTNGFGRGSTRLGATQGSETVVAHSVETGLSGTITRKAVVQRDAGTGTITVVAAPYAPAFILVEDITYEAGSSGAPAVGVGVLARQIVGSLVSVSSAPGVLITAPAVTVPSNRMLRISASMHFNAALAGGWYFAWQEDGSLLYEHAHWYSSPTAQDTVFFQILRSPPAGTHTYRILLSAIQAGGVVNMLGHLTPAHLIVEDIGAA